MAVQSQATPAGSEDLSAAVSMARAELVLLEGLLEKNRKQHRRGMYFMRLDRLASGLSRVLKDHQEVMTPAYERNENEDGGKDRRRMFGVCLQLEHLGSVALSCGSSLTALVARTHFMAFSIACLAMVARCRVLIAQMLFEYIQMFNSTGQGTKGFKSLRTVPDVLSCHWEGPHPCLRCHRNTGEGSNDAGQAGEDLGERCDRKTIMGTIESDSDDEQKDCLPIVNDMLPCDDKFVPKSGQSSRASPEKDLPGLTAKTNAGKDISVLLSAKVGDKGKSTLEEKVAKDSPSVETKEAFTRTSQPIKVGSTSSVGAKRRTFRPSFMVKDSQKEMDDIFNMLGMPKNKRCKK
eukprot:CAMPEP_0198243436 /NCGR_PEP_ID=MMETSP1446-20131203/27803_1 /TAXON_ID=1461542 ORGANISM="Unidentified sp, Strain CCMP2111" /NCGR_SAMPLE_ID=MMETSP1446 /ASSEMBLY_ACC=CAM_ASM_001112 /LENGTH=348 /DNA_ID=CAMNT_0043927253 /DNA_START=212 /DNA_END=1258 /DNA_ORIENTATION=+